MRRALLGCWLAAAAYAAPEQPPGDLLAHIRARMTEALSGLHNYTCRETMERSIRRAGAKSFAPQDLLRIEVAYLEGQEMFAWPGSARFGEKKIEDLIPGGTFATGNFGLLAQAVFVSGVADITFHSLSPGDPPNQARFDFRVARARAPMGLSYEGKTVLVGYHGFFTADRDSFNVSELEVEADDIPFSLQIFRAQLHMEYAVSRIGNSDSLLPQTSEVLLVDLSGRSSRIHVRFDGCHEFTGESTISFTEPAAVPEAAAPTAGPQTLPAGTELVVRLTMPVERGATAIGDTVSGEIVREARGPAPIPKGAAASLRITRILDVTDGRQVYHAVFFQLLYVEAGGRRYDVASAVLRGASGLSRSIRTKEGGILFRGPSFRIEPGCELTWRTVADERSK